MKDDEILRYWIGDGRYFMNVLREVMGDEFMDAESILQGIKRLNYHGVGFDDVWHRMELLVKWNRAVRGYPKGSVVRMWRLLTDENELS